MKITYKQFLIEQEKVIKKIEKTIEKDKETGEKSMSKTAISKIAQIQALAKDLYVALYRASTEKYEIKKKVAEMKKNGADDDVIADFTELQADYMTVLQTAGADIEAQMLAIAGASPSLAEKAGILAGEAKNLASKAIDEYMIKLVNKTQKMTNKKEDEK